MGTIWEDIIALINKVNKLLKTHKGKELSEALQQLEYVVTIEHSFDFLLEVISGVSLVVGERDSASYEKEKLKMLTEVGESALRS